VHYLDPQSVMKLRMVTKEINREGERAMHRVWRYLVAVNLSSPFITLPDVGGGDGQMSFTRAAYEVFFANKRQEVLIMGGIIRGQATNEVTKMIIELDGTILFEDGTPMLRARNDHTAIYHQGEVFSISSGTAEARSTTERLDLLTQTQTEFESMLPNQLQHMAAVCFDSNVVLVGGWQQALGKGVYSDMTFELSFFNDKSVWLVHEARLNTARRNAAAISFEGMLLVCGGGGEGEDAGRSVESFSDGCWQKHTYHMIKARSQFSLFVFEDELFAVGGEGQGQNTTIERLSRSWQQWRMTTNLGESRHGCTAALVGSHIFLFGGGVELANTFDFYNLRTKRWASHFDESMRQMPREVNSGACAVLVTPSMIKVWSRLDVLKLEDDGAAEHSV